MPKLVIFDKDGCLVDFNRMWMPWATSTVALLEATTQKPVGASVYKTLGVDPVRQKVSMGSLAEKTLSGIRVDVSLTLQEHHGFTPEEADDVVDFAVREGSPGQTAPVCDLIQLFLELKSMNMKIALCTADSRKQTEEQMHMLGIASMLDEIVCGNDKGIVPKPSPHCAMQICKRMGVELHEAIMVGDTVADLKMGRVAGLRASVGVLSGIGNEDTLKEYADHFLDDVSTLPDLIREKLRIRHHHI